MMMVTYSWRRKVLIFSGKACICDPPFDVAFCALGGRTLLVRVFSHSFNQFDILLASAFEYIINYREIVVFSRFKMMC